MLSDAAFRSANSRLKLAVRPKPYPGPTLARGVQLLYRRNAGAGAWVIRAADGHGKYSFKRLAIADDIEQANGTTVLDFNDAKKQGLTFARGDDGAIVGEAPLTVREALDRYAQDLASRGRATVNATRLHKLIPITLASRPVASLTGQELRAWRDGLAGKMAPASVNRTRVGLRAALRLAAGLDARITNQQAFSIGLKGVADANSAREVLLVAPGQVMAIVDAVDAINSELGLMTLVLAETGCRLSQAAALECQHLQDGCLLMPTSFKGQGKAVRHHEPVPISAELEARLLQARADRADGEPLLLLKGEPWSSSCPLRDPFRRAVESVGLDASRYTPYALRHSHIVALLDVLPVLRVAKMHDTSVVEIERHYAKYCNRDSNVLALARAALPQRTNNITQLRRVS